MLQLRRCTKTKELVSGWRETIFCKVDLQACVVNKIHD